MRKKINDSRALVLVALLAGLTGCSSLPNYANPIEWFRDATGASTNDASDQGQRNAQNLAAGNAEPYPNLATVPPPPDRAMSRVDLDKLKKGLVADRAHAKYSEQQLSEGHAVPPIPGQEPQVALAPPLTSAPGGTGQGAGAAPAAAGRRPGTAARGSQPAPAESPLTSPSIGNLPQGDQPRAAPPPPGGRGATGGFASGAGAPPGRAVPGQPPAVVIPTPPLPPPAISAAELAAVAAAPPVAARAPTGRGAAAGREIVRLTFAGDGTALGAGDQKRLAAVAERQKQSGGTVRITGYGGAGDAAEQKLQSFGLALDRANAVAAALVKLGVPAGRITVETAPRTVAGGAAAGQVAVLVER